MLKRALLMATFGAIAVASAFPVGATSWYPQACDAVDYCATVDNVTWVESADGGPPQLIVSSAHRKATVQKNFPVGESEDQRIHVCMRYDPFGDFEVTCLLVPSRVF
jgi:hypothetical protein